MPNIITPALLNAIFESYNFTFNDAFKAVTVDWPKVAMDVPSVTAAENYGWLGQFPRIREWIGEGKEYCEVSQKFGPAAPESARAFCYRSSPRHPHRCGRHTRQQRTVRLV